MNDDFFNIGSADERQYQPDAVHKKPERKIGAEIIVDDSSAKQKFGNKECDIQYYQIE